LGSGRSQDEHKAWLVDILLSLGILQGSDLEDQGTLPWEMREADEEELA